MLRSDHRTPFTARGTTKRVNETLDVYPIVCNSDIRILLLCYFSQKAKACVIKRARPVLQSRGLPPCFPLSCSKRISPMFCKARSLCCRDDRRVAAFCPPGSDVPGTVACSSRCFGSGADSDGKARTSGSSVWRKGRAGADRDTAAISQGYLADVGADVRTAARTFHSGGENGVLMRPLT